MKMRDCPSGCGTVDMYGVVCTSETFAIARKTDNVHCLALFANHVDKSVCQSRLCSNKKQATHGNSIPLRPTFVAICRGRVHGAAWKPIAIVQRDGCGHLIELPQLDSADNDH